MAITFGLDISNHQDATLDLAACRRAGCEFAIIKAGEGASYRDPVFPAHLAAARAAGMVVAAYWYQRSGSTAQAQAATIGAVVPRDLPLCLDVETGSGDVALTRALVDLLRSQGYRMPLLYLPRWYWQQLGSPSLSGLPPLWSSRYPDTVVGPLPAKWAQVPASYWAGYGGLDVAVLQFTASAEVAGYSPLDANAFRGTREEFAALLGYPAPGADFSHDEETTMEWPAGDNVSRALPCAGRPQFWYLYAIYGERIHVHQVDYVMPTDHPDRFVPGAGFSSGDDGTGRITPQTWTFDTDKPGPVTIPRHPDGSQPVGVIVRYSAEQPFTAYCG
ncbi:glycoside hydrolase family 25 protein [Amycolatopsis cynarae]|uniref:Glycoside hydrolase family 25 protein n=1 Tax=Amycolatopsis cynarae TaxID=2995223 RepID=A0ABY7B691_9PSEU|nr:glycoside hydrolase family 25 protein [Amycolatopsis sp. HUAS 11-8]WAL67173.1 glycoside hydrolase family 25 protein [Amycolatopsis sp. HUAS 11-8]